MSENDPLTPEALERLALYRAGALSPEARAAFEREVLEDDALAEALYRETTLDAVDQEAAAALVAPGRVLDARPALARAERKRRSWTGILKIAIPAAAALAVAFSITQWSSGRWGQTALEDTVRGGGTSVVMLAPLGDLDAPPTEFVWTEDPGAESYRVELYDEEGLLLGVHVTSSSRVKLEALRDTLLRVGEWRVVPIGADGAERPAPAPQRFRVLGP